MRIFFNEIDQGGAVEVCRGDQLIGYVLQFSAGWDVYECVPNGLRRLASGLLTRAEAEGLFAEKTNWRG